MVLHWSSLVGVGDLEQDCGPHFYPHVHGTRGGARIRNRSGHDDFKAKIHEI